MSSKSKSNNFWEKIETNKNLFADRLLFMFNKIRKKRHTAVYEQVNIISKEEAENAFKTAEEFVAKVNELLK